MRVRDSASSDPMKSERSLRAQQERVDAVALNEVVVEEKHGRKRCSEIIDHRALMFKLQRKLIDLVEERSGSFMLAPQARRVCAGRSTASRSTNKLH